MLPADRLYWIDHQMELDKLFFEKNHSSHFEQLVLVYLLLRALAGRLPNRYYPLSMKKTSRVEALHRIRIAE